MNNSYVEVTIPDGMLEFMKNLESEVTSFLIKPKSQYEKQYYTYRSWLTFKLIEHKKFLGINIPEHLQGWVAVEMVIDDYWYVSGTQMYYSLAQLVQLFEVNNTAILNQLHAAHFKQILDKFKGE